MWILNPYARRISRFPILGRLCALIPFTTTKHSLLAQEAAKRKRQNLIDFSEQGLRIMAGAVLAMMVIFGAIRLYCSRRYSGAGTMLHVPNLERLIRGSGSSGNGGRRTQWSA